MSIRKNANKIPTRTAGDAYEASYGGLVVGQQLLSQLQTLKGYMGFTLAQHAGDATQNHVLSVTGILYPVKNGVVASQHSLICDAWTQVAVHAGTLSMIVKELEELACWNRG